MPDTTLAQTAKLKADLRVLIHDAEEVLRITADQTGEGVQALRGRMRASLEQARTSLAQLQHGAVERARAVGHATDDYVHENPWRSIVTGAGVGLLLGLLIGRR